MSDLQFNDYYILANSQLFPIVDHSYAINQMEGSEAYAQALGAYQTYQAQGAQAALDQYASAIETYPQQPFFYACRALLCEEMGDSEGAFYNYQAAKRLDINYHHFLEWKENAGEMLESPELLELNQQLATPSNDPQPYINRAMLHVQHYCYDEAVADFAYAYTLHANPEYLLSKAAVYMRMLRYADALQLLSGIIKDHSHLWDAFLYRGKLYAAVQEMERAEEDFDTCVVSQPENKLYVEERAGFYEKVGKIEDAIKDYSALVALDPEDFFPYVMRADLYEKTGELLLAIGDYDKAISINPYYSDLYHYRAQLKEQIGDNAGAAQDRLRYEELERDE